MGSCCSKETELETEKSRPVRPTSHQKAKSSPPTKTKSSASKSGHRLGGPTEASQEGHSELGVSGKEAAARAAELRYNQKQNNLASSEMKLKTMAKVSKKDKGLA